MIRRIQDKEIPECVRVIRESFQTVADEFGFTRENAPRFTAFSTDEERVRWWKAGEKRLMFGFFEEDKLLGYYNLKPEGEACELGSLAVLPEARHRNIGSDLLHHAILQAQKNGMKLMKLSIVEENIVLRQWYESYGFVHTDTKKFDFFPFTCGYLERDLEKSPYVVKDLAITRGHIVPWLEERVPGLLAEEGFAYPRFVYIPGELTMDSKFYVYLFNDWHWIEKPAPATYLLSSMTVLGVVTYEEKVRLAAAIYERNNEKETNLQVVFD